jgi:hypothetical protein
MSFLKSEHEARICPKTGKILQPAHKHQWMRWLFPFTGLAALIWFLVRVIPKPSRAIYPCQRVALPLASGFIVWLLSLAGSAAAFHKAKDSLTRTRYVLATVVSHVSPTTPSARPRVFTRAESPGFTTPIPPTGPVPVLDNAGIPASALIRRLSIRCSQKHFVR